LGPLSNTFGNNPTAVGDLIAKIGQNHTLDAQPRYGGNKQDDQNGTHRYFLFNF
jgi:hypothetical protein